MPELPEVETMRRGILAAVGSRIQSVQRLPTHCQPLEIVPSPRTWQRRVVGRTIRDIGRAGKRVVIWLDSDEAIVLEPRMTGLVLVVDPPTTAHLRWRLRLAGGPFAEILYWDRRGLGKIYLYRREEFLHRYGPQRLGPDALTMTTTQWIQQLGQSRREIKPALLDQRAAAGIGNLYASEILHVAGIHPRRRCHDMTRRQWEALTAATQRVLQAAIAYEGSTLGDGTYRNALNKRGGYQNQHRVYNRAGQPCPRCPQQTIERIVQTQRSTFFCATCQLRKP